MMEERGLVFGRPDREMVGVLNAPDKPYDTAVLVVVGGPQYRVGSHRQFVSLSRRVAAQGFAVMRFDHGGMGDSAGPMQSFEALDDDIAAAIDVLAKSLPALRQVVLWGLCDGASAALLYWHRRRDPRVGGLCLLNPWTRSAHSLARTQVKHYYLQRLREPAFWRKLLSGGVAVGALLGLLRNLRAASRSSARSNQRSLSFQDRMAAAWMESTMPLLLILSGSDYTAKEFLETIASAPAWAGALDRPALQRCDLEAADHTFSDVQSKSEVERLTIDWLSTMVLRPQPEGCAR